MKIQPDLAFAGSIVTLATLAGWALNNADADSRGELGKWFGLAPPHHRGIDRMFPFSSFAMYTPREYNTHPKGVRTSFATLLVVTALQLVSAALQQTGRYRN